MAEPFVSILILVYNNIDGLERTVNSVLAQTYSSAEIILSDDGSTNYDTSRLTQYADRLRERFPKVILNCNPVNVGTVKHLNRVIAMAEGKYLFNCSSGDQFYDSHTVENLTLQMEAAGASWITGQRMDVYPGGRKKRRPGFLTGFAIKYLPGALLNYMVKKRNVLSGSCTFPSKALFEAYGPYDEAYHLVEDYPYYVMLLQERQMPLWYAKPVIVHEIGGVSTGRVHPSIYKDIEKMREKLLQNPKGLWPGTIAFLRQCVSATQTENEVENK